MSIIHSSLNFCLRTLVGTTDRRADSRPSAHHCVAIQKAARVKILIVNQHTQNFGDDAACTALLRMILDRASRPVDSVTIVFNGPQGVAPPISTVSAPEDVRLKDVGRFALVVFFAWPALARLAFRGRPLARFLRLVDQADVIFVAPSGANIGIYRDWPYLIRLAIIVRQGRQPIFVWNTIGASGSAPFDLLARYVLKRAGLFVRERASAAYLEHLGLQCEVGYDTAFALEPVRAGVRDDVLTIVPAELDSWHPSYRAPSTRINALLAASIGAAVAPFARHHDMRVEILPHLRSIEEADFHAQVRASLVSAGLPTTRIQLRTDIESVEMYDEALATSKLVLGGRYHAVVLAAKNRRPFVSLSYENKMTEACAYLDLQDFDVDITSLGEDLTIEIGTRLEQALTNEGVVARVLESQLRGKIIPRLARPLERCGLRPQSSESA